MEAEDTFYLGVAAKLAKLGEAKAFPNPIVGAVIVCNDTVIGEGFHQKYGEAHAEPNAISNLKRNIFIFLKAEKKTEKYFEVNPEFSYLGKAEELNIFFKKTLENCPVDESKNIEDIIDELVLNICRKATIYVSLEPCNHYGKTAPCTELIHRLAFKRLVYACHDPNPLLTAHYKHSSPLNSSEIKAPSVKRFYLDDLKKSGMDVLCLEDYADYIKFDNRIFFESIDRKNKTDSEKIPKNYWLTLKVASYANGSMETKTTEVDDENAEIEIPLHARKTWITNSNSRKDVQRLRATHEVLITGINTIKNDNPLLNVRFSASELNLSDISDREIIILKSSQDFNDTERQSLNIFSSTYQEKVTEYIINRSGEKADTKDAVSSPSESPQSEKVFPNLSSLLNHLSSEKKLRIMVEAGPNLMKSFLKEGLVDEIIHYEPLSQSLSNILDRYQNLLKESPLNRDLCFHRSNEVLRKSQKCYLSRYEIIEAANVHERTDIKVHIKITDSERL
jgi:diaminohydroxyphosphoribosylaminopyrimidine deaminase/5-amino-6-(5-phosphoribosylamino)uracil reductase